MEPAPAVSNSEVGLTGPHIRGLDGIRAVAVVGVLGFHGGVPGFGGGLLGVDIFFVLSGFLITSLLVGEWARTGTLSFRRFYERRARRLLPGLFILLLLVAAYAQWFAETDTLSTLRGDALATILYVANWRFIFSGQSYFVHFGPPSPLLHTWSLAVEEQFYLVWPAVALFTLRRGGRRSLAVVAGIAMVASAVLTPVLLHQGVSVSRLYYGTDTRVQEVMAGALLAIAAPAIARHARAWRWPVTALGGLGALFLLWALHSVSGQGNFLYQGGFLLVAAASRGGDPAGRGRASGDGRSSPRVGGTGLHRPDLLRAVPVPLSALSDDRQSAHRSVGIGPAGGPAERDLRRRGRLVPLHRDAGPSAHVPQGSAPGGGPAHQRGHCRHGHGAGHPAGACAGRTGTPGPVRSAPDPAGRPGEGQRRPDPPARRLHGPDPGGGTPHRRRPMGRLVRRSGKDRLRPRSRTAP